MAGASYLPVDCGSHPCLPTFHLTFRRHRNGPPRPVVFSPMAIKFLQFSESAERPRHSSPFLCAFWSLIYSHSSLVTAIMAKAKGPSKLPPTQTGKKRKAQTESAAPSRPTKTAKVSSQQGSGEYAGILVQNFFNASHHCLRPETRNSVAQDSSTGRPQRSNAGQGGRITQLNKLEVAQAKKQMGSASGRASGPVNTQEIPIDAPLNPMAPKRAGNSKSTTGLGTARSNGPPAVVSTCLASLLLFLTTLL